MSGEARIRQAARVLLLDERDRVLLVKVRNPDTGLFFWHTPGGGVEPGENVRIAAAREVREETGLDRLPPAVELRRRRNRFTWKGVVYDQDERWFLARVSHFSPEPAGLNDGEEVDFIEWRWWTLDALEATGEELRPEDLGSWVRALLHDDRSLTANASDD